MQADVKVSRFPAEHWKHLRTTNVRHMVCGSGCVHQFAGLGLSGGDQVFYRISLIGSVLRRPDVVERLTALGIEPVGSSPEEFNRFFRAEIEKWTTVIKATGIAIEKRVRDGSSSHRAR